MLRTSLGCPSSFLLDLTSGIFFSASMVSTETSAKRATASSYDRSLPATPRRTEASAAAMRIPGLSFVRSCLFSPLLALPSLSGVKGLSPHHRPSLSLDGLDSGRTAFACALWVPCDGLCDYLGNVIASSGPLSFLFF